MIPSRSERMECAMSPAFEVQDNTEASVEQSNNCKSREKLKGCYHWLESRLIPSFSIDELDPSHSIFQELKKPIFPRATNFVLSVGNSTETTHGRKASNSISSEPERSDEELADEHTNEEKSEKVQQCWRSYLDRLQGKTQWSNLSFTLKFLFMLTGLIVLFVILFVNSYNPMSELGNVATLSCNNYYWSEPWRVMRTCGVNAIDCMPFDSRTPEFNEEGWFTVRCPSGCDKSYGDRVFGSGVYTADSRLCASAIHAGAIGSSGGCANVRFVGAKSRFESTEQNGVTSHPYGWFPKGMEFQPVEGETKSCGAPNAWTVRVYTALLNTAVAIMVRPPALVSWLYMVESGFWTVALTSEIGDAEDFARTINELSTNEHGFVLAIAFLLWHATARDTFPDPRKFPLDAVMFYAIPFNAAILIDFLMQLGITAFREFSLSSNGYIALNNATLVLLLTGVLIIVVGILILLPYRLQEPEFRGVHFPFVLSLAAVAVLVFIGFPGVFSFHLHHYMLGVLMVLAVKGASPSRFQMLVQALGLGLFVSGVAVWEPDPLFDVRVSYVPDNSLSANYYAMSQAGPPVWLGTLDSESSTEIRLVWTITRSIEPLNCTAEELSGTKELLSSIKRIQENPFRNEIWQKWESEQEFWFALTMNNVLIHEGSVPSKLVQNPQTGAVTEVFVYSKAGLLTNTTYVFRLAQLVEGRSQGATSETFYAQSGAAGTLQQTLPTVLDVCQSVNATASLKLTEKEKTDTCFCEGFRD